MCKYLFVDATCLSLKKSNAYFVGLSKKVSDMLLRTFVTFAVCHLGLQKQVRVATEQSVMHRLENDSFPFYSPTQKAVHGIRVHHTERSDELVLLTTPADLRDLGRFLLLALVFIKTRRPARYAAATFRFPTLPRKLLHISRNVVVCVTAHSRRLCC